MLDLIDLWALKSGVDRTDFRGGSTPERIEPSTRFSPEVRERAVRLAQEYQVGYASLWGACEPITPKLVVLLAPCMDGCRAKK